MERPVVMLWLAGCWLTDAEVAAVWGDADGDGFAVSDGDCDDLDADRNPGEDEVWYDGVDQDCDGNDADKDGDGYGVGNDCDDWDAAVSPGTAETCDDLDNNCDGLIDEGVASLYYADADGDGFGDDATHADACEAPAGYVSNSDDCDDTSADVYPGRAEICDELDNDCDGNVDETC